MRCPGGGSVTLPPPGEIPLLGGISEGLMMLRTLARQVTASGQALPILPIQALCGIRLRPGQFVRWLWLCAHGIRLERPRAHAWLPRGGGWPHPPEGAGAPDWQRPGRGLQVRQRLRRAAEIRVGREKPTATGQRLRQPALMPTKSVSWSYVLHSLKIFQDRRERRLPRRDTE